MLRDSTGQFEAVLPVAMRIDFKRFVSLRWPVIVLAVALIAALLIFAVGYYRHTRIEIQQHKIRELEAIANLKRQETATWRKKHLGNATKFANSPLVHNAIDAYERDPSARAVLLERLQHEIKHEEYEEVLLFSPSRQLMLSTEENPTRPGKETMRALEKAEKLRVATFSELFRSSQGFTELDAVAAVLGPRKVFLAFVVMRINAGKHLFPMINTRLITSPSAAIFLVRREQDGVALLNNVESSNGATRAKPVTPIGGKKLEAGATFDSPRHWEGRDRRGVEVVAVLSPVVDSPWCIVARIDASEISEEARYRAVIVQLAVVVFLAFTVVLVGYFYHRRQAGLLREQMQSEIALRASEQVFQTQFANSPDIILIIDRRYKILKINRGLVGRVTAEELIGSDAIEILPAGERELSRKYVDACFATGRLQEFEHEIAEGVFVRARIAPLPGKRRIENLMIISTDITEQKRAQQEREKLFEQVFLAQKMESIGTLAGGVAHDFNNLLAGLMGGIALMELRLGKEFQYYNVIQEMKEIVNRGADLSRQLLGFARRGKFEVRVLDLNDVLEKTAKMFGRMRKDIVVRFNCFSASARVEADRTQIEQVLLNLFVNAGEAMPNGGELSLSTETVELSADEVEPRGIKPGRYLKLTVADTGVGMTAETQQRIFEPFFTTKERGRGTGLGLASVYGIVRNHGGFITVESEPDNGATFFTYLPVSDKPIAQQSAAPNALPGKGEVILVVDDEKQVADSISRVLETLGYRAYPVYSGHEAVGFIKQHPKEISVVLLDMIMPEMSGGETFDALRKIDPSLKVILSSGYSLEGKAKEILNRGCNGFIQKPFDGEALSAKLAEVLV
ncbi:MAG: response regulator [Deltaproteobacteria bacterium]|nr:response regulator [Deltaproteobacteria bacterium]